MAKAERRRGAHAAKGMSIWKKILIAIIIILVVCYGIGAVLFMNRFNINTKVNGVDASFKTPQEVSKLVEKKTQNYVMNIVEKKGNNEKLSGKDIDLKYIDDGKINKIKAQQKPYLWFMGLFEDEEISGELTIKYDAKKLDDIIGKYKFMGKDFGEASRSAYPEFDQKEKKYKAHPEFYGNKVDHAKFKSQLDKAIKAEKSVFNMEKEGVYVQPKNKKDNKDLAKAIEELNKYAKVKIVYDFKYEKQTLDGKDLVGLFDIDVDGNYGVKLNKDKVREYVRSMSRKYSTYGDTRDFTTATGKKIKVYGGSYGWLIDREKETDALYNMISEKKSQENREPIYQQKALYRDKDDLGNNYIEISLAAQTMWLVKDGKPVLSTPIVTGDVSKGYATPPGVYPINYKQRGATLKGPGYASPVTYWIPFNGNIGIHDAPWKSSFGGSIYQYDGSRGCINTPYSKVQYIFNNVKPGEPVVVY